MSAIISIGGIATASSDYPHESAAHAFDGSNDTKWYNGDTFDGVKRISSQAWLQYDFPAGRKYIVTAYAIVTANDMPERDPRIWQLHGSCDGFNKHIMMLQGCNQGGPQACGELPQERHRKITWDFATSYAGIPLSHVRLRVYANKGGANFGVQLAQLILYGFAAEMPNPKNDLLLIEPITDTITDPLPLPNTATMSATKSPEIIRLNGSGIASASHELNTQYYNQQACNAFDGSLASKWYSAYGMHTDIWLALAFINGPHIITSYAVSNGDCKLHERDPRDWKLQGSNDGGKTWDTLHSVTGVTYRALKQLKQFNLASPSQPFCNIRLLISGNARGNLAAEGVEITTFNLYGYPAADADVPSTNSLTTVQAPVAEETADMSAATNEEEERQLMEQMTADQAASKKVSVGTAIALTTLRLGKLENTMELVTDRLQSLGKSYLELVAEKDAVVAKPPHMEIAIGAAAGLLPTRNYSFPIGSGSTILLGSNAGFPQPSPPKFRDWIPAADVMKTAAFTRNPNPAAMQMILARPPAELTPAQWTAISRHPSAEAIALLKAHPGSIDWSALSANTSPAAVEMLRVFEAQIDWRALSGNRSEEALALLAENRDKICIEELAANYGIFQ